MPRRKKKAGAKSQGCGASKPAPPPEKHCFLNAIEISKTEKPERKRGSKEVTKYVVLPSIAKQSAGAGAADEFNLFDPSSGTSSSVPTVHLVAIRANLVDDDNKATKIKAVLRDHAPCDFADDTHQKLTIDKDNDSGLLTRAREWKDSATEFIETKTKQLEKVKDAYRQAKRVKKSLEILSAQWQNDKIGAVLDSLKELTKGKTKKDDDEKDDGKDTKSAPHELEAVVFPQQPLVASLMSSFPKTLASWCPESCGWTGTVPGLVDVFQALWTTSHTPREYTITASSCGNPPSGKIPTAGTELTARLLVYPADQFKFIVRVPAPIKAEAGFDGRYISKGGDDQELPKWEVETTDLAVETPLSGGDEESGTDEAQDEETPSDESTTTTAPPLSVKEQNEALFKMAAESGPTNVDDDDDDDEPAPLLEISNDTLLLPWDDQEAADEDEGDEDEGGEEDAEEEDEPDDDWDATVEKPLIKLTRTPTVSDEDPEENDDELYEVRQAVHTIVTVLQQLREAWNSMSGLSYTIGFSISFTASFLEGKLDWEWGWRDAPLLEDRPKLYADSSLVKDEEQKLPVVVFCQKYKGQLKLFALEVSLKLGIDLTFATIQFRCALIGEIKGELKIDKEGTKEYCPEAGKYYKTATEDWTASEITGNLRLQMLLFSADTVNVGGDIETGYSVKGRLTRGLSGGDVGPAVEYAWQFSGVNMKAWFSVKGWKAIEKEVELIAEGDENKGCFPHCTSRDVQKARQKVMKYQRQCWDIKSQVQKLIGDVRLAYINEIFFLTREEMTTKVNVRRSNPLFYEYDACPTDAWIAQLRHTAKKRVTSRWQSVTDRVTSAWGAYDVQDEECTGILNPEDDRDIAGEQPARLLWKLRVLFFFYKQICEAIAEAEEVCAEAISELTAAEQAALAANSSDEEPSPELVEAAREKIHDLKDLWEEGKFQKYAEGAQEYIENLNRMVLFENDLLRDALENAYFDSTGELVVP